MLILFLLPLLQAALSTGSLWADHLSSGRLVAVDLAQHAAPWAVSASPSLAEQPAESSSRENSASIPLVRPDRNLVVVFIHGTIVPMFSLSSLGDTFKRIFTDESTDQSFYDVYLNSMRTKSMFKMQPIGDVGLVQVLSDASDEATPAARLAWFYKQLYQRFLPPDYRAIQCYTFGWAGKLDLEHRMASAQELFDGLAQVARAHERRGRAVDFIIVAHSHGGNVALHLANFYQHDDTPFHIKQLVLLGTPVLVESEECVRSPMFEKIYSLYSRSDTMQVSDILSSKKGRARRLFGTHRGFTRIPPNVRQINVALAGRQPYHVELWAFPHEGGLMFYREYLCIYPFPVAVFVPAIIHLVDKVGSAAAHCFLDILRPGQDYSYELELKTAVQLAGQFKRYAFSLPFHDVASCCGITLNE